MGVFIKNKSKAIQKKIVEAPVLVNKKVDELLIGDEKFIPSKRSIKVGLNDKKSKKIESFKKENPVLISKNNTHKKTIQNTVKELLFEKNQNDVVSNSVIKINKKLPNNYALVSILDDRFSQYFYVFLNSFLENNKWFDGDLIILYNDDLSHLSDENIEKLKFLYRKIVFKKIKTEGYFNLIELFKTKVSKTFHRFIPSVLTIETFNLIDYDRVVYLDSDTLVIGDLFDLFRIENDIVATRDTSNYITDTTIKVKNDDSILLNGGFLSLSGKFMRSDEHVKNMIELFPKISEPKFLDQTLMNTYFKNFDVLFLSSDYNLLKRCFDDDHINDFNKAIKDIKVIHYVGQKPWDEKTKEFEKNYKFIEGIWSSYRERYENFSNKIGDITLISSGIDNNNLSRLADRINDTNIVTTNWGFKYDNIVKIDYYYCSTPENTLLESIIDSNFEPKKQWLMTTNVENKFNGLIKKKIKNVDPFNIMMFRSAQYKSINERRKKNKKLPLPTSGVSMLLFFSLQDISSINIIGYNLYTKKNSDGSYKQHGSSKLINPYTDESKPHTIEFDLNLIIFALNKMIINGVKINIYESDIIQDIFDLIKDKNSTGKIITKIKSKYYE